MAPGPADFLSSTAPGTRVVARYRIAGGFTDALGYLRSCDETTCVIETRRSTVTVMLSEQRRLSGEPIAPAGEELRDYGVGAQILIDLGVKEMVLLTNSKKSIVGIEGFGLKVVGQKPVPGRPPQS